MRRNLILWFNESGGILDRFAWLGTMEFASRFDIADKAHMKVGF